MWMSASPSLWGRCCGGSSMPSFRSRRQPEKLKALLPEHLEYMIGLERRGLLFASGPLGDGAGPPNGAGLTVLRVASAQEARALADADPFVVNGLRTYELKEWTIMEGTLGLRVNLSDQSIEVA